MPQAMTFTMLDSPFREPYALAQTKPNAPGLFPWNDLPDEMQLDIIRFSFDGKTLYAHAQALSNMTSGGLQGTVDCPSHRHTYDTNISINLLLVSRRTKEMVRDMLIKYVHLTLDARRIKWGYYPSEHLEGRPWWQKLGLTTLGVRDLVLESLDDIPLIACKSNFVNLERLKLTRTCKVFGNAANEGFGSIAVSDLVTILQNDNALLKAEILRCVTGMDASTRHVLGATKGFALHELGHTVLYLTVSILLEFSDEDYAKYEVPSHELASNPTKSRSFVD